MLLVSSGLAQKGGGKPPKPGPAADPAIAYEQGSTNLNVMNDDGSHKTTIYSASFGGFRPSWSPDGHSLAFHQGAGGGLRRIDVTVVNGEPQGSNLIILAGEADCGFCQNPAWSPLGNEIAVDGGGFTLPGLYVIPASGGAGQTLYTPPAGSAVRSPTWSPDGVRIAFIEVILVEEPCCGIADPVIKILNRATGTVTNTLLQGQFADITEVDWARTQDTLAFSASTGGDFSVYTLDLPAGPPSFVIDGRGPSWSPDDTKLAFSDGKVKSITLATGAVKTLVNNGGGFPDWRR
jgi:Tol biopolymer transport system component